MKFAIAYGLVGLGALLLILSGVWTTIFNGKSTWTPEKAARSSEIKARLHNLAFTVNSPTPSLQRGEDLGKLKAEYEQLRKENDELNADFKSAAEAPKSASQIMKWSGISLAAIGLVGWYAAKQSA
jgi:hypothetical protein